MSFNSPRQPGTEYVTREELTVALDRLSTELKLMMNDGLKEVANKVDKLDTYSHESNHRFANGLEQVRLKLERVAVLQEMTLPAARAARPAPEPSKEEPT